MLFSKTDLKININIENIKLFFKSHQNKKRIKKYLCLEYEKNTL